MAPRPACARQAVLPVRLSPAPDRRRRVRQRRHVPPLEISYRIESKVTGGDTTQGRDQTTTCCRVSVRLLSIVPEDTIGHPRSAGGGVPAVESRESRANLLQTSARVLFGLAGCRAARDAGQPVCARRMKVQAESWRVPARAIASAARSELNEVRQSSRGGWDADLAGRALAAARVAASMVAGRAVGQSRASSAHARRAGSCVVKALFGRGDVLCVRRGDAADGSRTAARSVRALRALTRGRYGAHEKFDSAETTAAIEDAGHSAHRRSTERAELHEHRRRFREVCRNADGTIA